MRGLSRMTVAGLGAAGAAVVLAVGPAAAASASTLVPAGIAYGEYVSVTNLQDGAVQSGPEPQATIPSGYPDNNQLITSQSPGVSVSGFSIFGPVPILATGKMTVSTRGSSSSSGSQSQSTADVQNVNILNGTLTFTDLNSLCDLEDPGLSSGSNTTLGTIGGTAASYFSSVGSQPAPNTSVTIPGVGTAVLDQTGVLDSNNSIGTFTVDALDLSLAAGGSIILGQSQCSIAAGSTVTVPVGAAGGVLLAGLTGVGFVMYQGRQRWRSRPAR